ncbi:hypothetical protein QBZ16_002390 [Prototheca wickerhamii]|uniref:Uncharacterized protein n=1 Tax=Prototheca wickerhamii TaxID=3111 RepID=A0AAD9MLN5_PROWI|nr:hypothetical protein QBZ16_002390 [Prototheca wickerhamii]
MSDEHVAKLEGVVAQLNEAQSAVKYEKKSLAQLLAGLQQFMEDALGINSMYKSQPKLPGSVFRDFSSSGPMHVIGLVCAEAMKARGMKRIDWASPALRRENLELVSRLRQELLRGGFIQLPRVHVHRTNGATDSLRLSHIVTKLGGETVEEDAPDATHVVLPFGPGGDPDDGQTYLRAQERHGGVVRVHWWYLPGSYDEWLPAAAAPEELQPDRPRRGPWRVYARWLLDSEKYNEWMEPADYETEEAAAAAEEGAKRGREEGGEEAAALAAKKARLAATRGGLEVAPDAEPVLLGPGFVRQTLAQPNRRAMSGVGALDISQGQHRAGAEAPQAPPPAQEQATKPVLEAYRVPSCAGWFRWGAAYLRYRNAMIDKYREEPSRELTFTEARRWLAGDVGTLRRIHAFSALRRARGGRGRRGGRRRRRARGRARAAGLARPPAADGARFFCNAMPWVDCTALRYHCVKLPDVDLCPLAYAEGRFPPGCSAQDFVKIENNEAPPDPSGWTNKEQLLLLEGVEKHGEDWAAIAEFVGTKNPMQCCTRFLQMPIEEAILAEGMAANGQRGWVAIPEPGEEETTGAEAAALGPLPFADVSNPIMAQLAFLTTMVGPKVAAAAAQRALETLAEEDEAALADAKAEGDEAAIKSEAGAQDAIMKDEQGEELETALVPADRPLPATRLRAAAATALAAAAAKAKLLADAEEREMQRLVLAAVDVQCKKINLKLQHLERLDELMARERAQLESLRSTFIASHLSSAAQAGGEASSAPAANGVLQAVAPGLSGGAATPVPAPGPTRSATPPATVEGFLSTGTLG